MTDPQLGDAQAASGGRRNVMPAGPWVDLGHDRWLGYPRDTWDADRVPDIVQTMIEQYLPRSGRAVLEFDPVTDRKSE